MHIICFFIGEGAKPIFERDELKTARIKSEEVEEHRTVVVLDTEHLATKSHSSRKQCATSSPLRNRSPSSQRGTSSRHSRHEDQKRQDDRTDHHRDYKNDRNRERSGERSLDRSRGRSLDRSRGRSRDRSRGRSRDRRERYKESRRYSPHIVDEERLRSDRRDHSSSRYRDERQWERNSHRGSMQNDRAYREYRERSRERPRERREEERLRDRRFSMPHYIEQVPVPVYYGNFPLRPIVVGPLVPLRGQVPLGRGRHPQLMGPVRSFPPRFLPPDMYRMGAPPNPRFGPIL
ncbi:hypothetical protein KM043_015401 [Ampulex compressa]|nr:hypothetical protein KM043_015401 [Ampulex compressa]